MFKICLVHILIHEITKWPSLMKWFLSETIQTVFSKRIPNISSQLTGAPSPQSCVLPVPSSMALYPQNMPVADTWNPSQECQRQLVLFGSCDTGENGCICYTNFFFFSLCIFWNLIAWASFSVSSERKYFIGPVNIHRICKTIHDRQVMEPAYTSIHRGMYKESVVFIHKDISFSNIERRRS